VFGVLQPPYIGLAPLARPGGGNPKRNTRFKFGLKRVVRKRIIANAKLESLKKLG
jgi:hypothetical protein